MRSTRSGSVVARRLSREARLTARQTSVFAVASAALMVLMVPAAWAQSAGGPSRSLALQPSASITQTFSNNYLQSAVDPSAESITNFTAGMVLRSRTGLVQGFADYSLSGLVYARHPEQNTFQNALRSTAVAELIQGRAQVEVAASISQSAISAFGVQPGVDGTTRSNSTEVRNLQISPTFRGPLGPDLRYSAALSYGLTDSRSTNNGDSTSTTVSLHVEPTHKDLLTWSVDGSVLRSDFAAGRNSDSSRLFGGLSSRLDNLDLRLNATAGVELTDVNSANRQRYVTWGAGVVWAPSRRTNVAAQYDHRFFGASHNITLEHRTALMVFRVTSSRSMSTSGNQQSSGGLGTAFDLYFNQFASIEPDRNKRADLVNAFLRDQNILPAANAGFLQSSASIQNQQQLSAAWRGVRSAAVLTYSQSTSTQLGLTAGLLGDFANSTEVNLRTVALDLSHRLTPMSAFNLVMDQQQGSGNLSSQRSDKRQIGLNYTTRPNMNGSLSAGMRRALYDNLSGRFNETVVFATYGLRF